jgi:sulfoxide reductase heme-binding subunit YedZ
VSDTILWYTSRGAGAVTMVLLSSVVVLGILSHLRVQSPRWPRFLTTGLHRNVSLLALVFLALHVITAVVDPFTHLGWLAAVIPFSSYYRTFWLGLGVIAVELMTAIVVTSLVRGFVGHGAWRAIHWLAYAAWPLAIAHGLGTGTDSWSAWMFGLTAACVLAVVMATIYRLLAGPSDPMAAARAGYRSAVERRIGR